jgi:tetratricopeptide (TPR) repeat protein
MAPPDPRRGAVLAALAAALTAALLYAPTLGHGFAFDDAPEVVRNDHIRSLGNVGKMFASGAWDGAGERNPIYRPLTSVTYAVDHAVAGLSPAAFHVSNVVLHAVASALVVLLALRLGVGVLAAALAGLVFAVHPVHVEVAANVAGRKDALATVFVVLSVLAHDTALRRGRAFLVLPVLALAAALFSKESGAAAIAVIAAWDLLLHRETWRAQRRRALGLYAAYAAVAVLYLVARRAAVGSLGVPVEFIPFVENPLAHAPALPRVLTAVAVLGRGLALLVLPRTLAPDYSFDAIPLVASPADGWFLASAATLALLAAVALRTWRSWPLVAFAIAWYAAAIFPASNLVVKVGTTFGERLLYLPSVGFCVVAGVALARLAAPGAVRPLRVAAVAAIALALAARTLAYERVWADEVALFGEAVEAQPRSAKAHALLGAAFMEVGRAEEGTRELERSLALLAGAPGPHAEDRVKLGVAYERTGRSGDAAAVYEGILRDVPDFPDALWRLGVVRWAQGRRDEGARLWERTLQVAPDHARAMSDLGIAALARGDAAAAEALWRRAAQVDPRAPGPWLSLGNLYDRRGDAVRARDAWRRFLERAQYGAYARERQLVEARLRQQAPPVKER